MTTSPRLSSVSRLASRPASLLASLLAPLRVSLAVSLAVASLACDSSVDPEDTGASAGSSGTTTPQAETQSETQAQTTDTETTSPTTTVDPGTTGGMDGSDSTTIPGTTVGPGDSSGGETTVAGPPMVRMETTLGDIVIELHEIDAPVTVENFLSYVEGGFYDGVDGQGATVFHRVIPGFVIQGGGLTAALEQKATLPPIVNEHDNGLTNDRGTLSMARTNDPNSATSQFFVNLEDNAPLDDPPGYAVFGRVVEGMDVVDAIAGVQTTTMQPYEDVPVEPIEITSATVL